jgi:aryl-alcohol dehydrogenase-like predicted oxidoreductase
MRKVKLGNSPLELSVIGFGAWAIGGSGWSYAWGPQDDQDSIKAIHAALDAGINWIDTAHVYGHGHSEEVVGRAIRGRRSDVIVATKCGLLKGNDGTVVQCLKKNSVREELEGSLRRLGVDVIDLYQIHWPNPEEDIEEAWTVLADAKEKGLVRAIGVSNFNVAQMERVARIAPIHSLQPPYSMWRRAIESEIQPFCHKNNIGIVAYSPMVSGFLTGKLSAAWVKSLPEDDWRRNNVNAKDPALTANIAFIESVIRPIAKAHKVGVGEIAIAWTLRGGGITSAIVGGRSPEQVKETARAAEVKLSIDELQAIEVGLKKRLADIGE